MSLLQLDNVSKSFGNSAILRNVHLRIEPGERHAIIGPNGAGKSTLFHLISGRQQVSAGRILFKGEPIHTLPTHEIARRGLARSFQVSSLFAQLSVFENLRCALLWPLGYGYSFWHLLSREKALNARTESLLDELGRTRLCRAARAGAGPRHRQQRRADPAGRARGRHERD